jgi:hypothetical protein
MTAWPNALSAQCRNCDEKTEKNSANGSNADDSSLDPRLEDTGATKMVRSEDLHGVFTRYETDISRMRQVDYAIAHRVRFSLNAYNNAEDAWKEFDLREMKFSQWFSPGTQAARR